MTASGWPTVAGVRHRSPPGPGRPHRHDHALAARHGGRRRWRPSSGAITAAQASRRRLPPRPAAAPRRRPVHPARCGSMPVMAGTL